MTKRVNMTSEPPAIGRPHRGLLWPILFAGAAAGATWSGIDPELIKANGADILQQVMVALGPLIDGFYGYFDGSF